MPRLFIGTFVARDDQSRLSLVRSANANLDNVWQRRIRWVKPEKLHMTWLFLGDIEQEKIAAISGQLTTAAQELRKDLHEAGALTLTFEQAEIWPNAKMARMCVLIPTLYPVWTAAVARKLRTALKGLYQDKDEERHNRPFKPHVTLLRLDKHADSKGKCHPDANEIVELEERLPFSIDCSQISLIESHLGTGDDQYVILQNYKLVQ